MFCRLTSFRLTDEWLMVITLKRREYILLINRK